MKRNWPLWRKWLLRFLVAVLIVGVAAGLRWAFLSGLGRGIAYLTFYPAVMLAALYGGFLAGLFATALSALLAFFWIQQGYLSSVEWLAMAVFLFSCILISAICETTLRAQARARQAKERAEAANRAKSVFLASMSHELRTPLNAILGFSSLMRNEGGLADDQRRTLDIINRSGEHLLTLINDVLDMSKIEAGSLTLAIHTFDLGETVLEIYDLMRQRAEGKGLKLLLDQSSEFPRFVQGDSAKLRQVIINLTGNAIKFTPQGSVTLRLRARPADNPKQQWLRVEVEDTGVGIGLADQERIFDPFVQVGAQAVQRGTGLGLAITRQFVQMMNGRVGVESTPGAGSKFWVEIPVGRADEKAIQAVSADRGRVIGLAPDQPEYRILIVEDERDNWLLLRRLLEDVGFTVQVAENGLAGVEQFQAWRPHYIWMDVRMPIMDGLEATKRIRALEGGQEVIIVALSASVFKEQRDEVLASGMNDFARKPFRFQEIYDCMARHLGVTFLYEQPPLQAADKLAEIPVKALSELPRELKDELIQALIGLNSPLIDELIERVTRLHPTLGAILAQHAGRFGYTAMLKALHAEDQG